jgi:Aromatic-ring-opening dioxygenase LigAB, LigA subunit
MSINSVNHLCRDITRDSALRRAFLEDPEGALVRYPRKFTEAERAALLAGDVGTLYQMGVNAYVMGYLGRYGVFGLTVQSYSERVRTSEAAKSKPGQPILHTK